MKQIQSFKCKCYSRWTVHWQQEGFWETSCLHRYWSHPVQVWTHKGTAAIHLQLIQAPSATSVSPVVWGWYVVSDSFDPMDCSLPGLYVLHYLLKLAQTHVKLSQWCHPPISSSAAPFSFCLLVFKALLEYNCHMISCMYLEHTVWKSSDIRGMCTSIKPSPQSTEWPSPSSPKGSSHPFHPPCKYWPACPPPAFFFEASLQHLSSLIRDWTWATAVKAPNPNH